MREEEREAGRIREEEMSLESERGRERGREGQGRRDVVAE